MVCYNWTHSHHIAHAYQPTYFVLYFRAKLTKNWNITVCALSTKGKVTSYCKKVQWADRVFNERNSLVTLPLLMGITFTSYLWKALLDVLCPLSIVPMKKRCSCRNPEGNLSFVHTWLVDTWKRTPHYKKQVDQSNRPLYWFRCLLSKAAENKFPLAVGVWKQGINTRQLAPW